MSPFDADAYWENRLRARYDERGVGDIGMSVGYNSHLYVVRRRVFRRCLNRLDLEPSRTRVLDVGSGTGVYIDEWQNWGAAEITGLDITQTAVARLRATFTGARFMQADIGEALVADDTGRGYDVVSAFDVLFHILDDARYQRALQNIYTAIRPRGWFLCSENLAPVETRVDHYVSRSESHILNSLRGNGFDIVARMPMFVLMNDPVRSRNRLLRRWYSGLHRIAASERVGRVVGAMLLPIELIATLLIKQGPGTEVILCRKSETK